MWRWIAAATALALALRLLGLGADSLWADEALTWQMTRLPFSVVIGVPEGVSCPGYYVLAKVSTTFLGESEFALRLPAALLMTAAVPLIALLALRTGGPAAAVFAAFVAALATQLLHYGQEARGYGLLVFSSALTLLAFARTFDMGDGEPRPRARDVLALGLSGALLFYAHPYGILEAGGLGLLVLGRWIARRRCPWAPLLGLALAGALFLPFVPHFSERTSHAVANPWLTPTSPLVAARAPGSLLFWGRGDTALAIFGLLVVVACARLPRSWRRLAFALALACWIAPAVYSRLRSPLFQDRYCLGLAPLALAAVGNLVARAARLRRRSGLVAGAFLIVAMAAFAIRYHATRPHHSDWRTAFAELERAEAAGAIPVVVARGTGRLRDYYVQGRPLVWPSGDDDEALDWNEPLPPGRIVIISGLRYRDAILKAAKGRTIVRERPRTSRFDQVVLEIR